jgi:hypothetical protein
VDHLVVEAEVVCDVCVGGVRAGHPGEDALQPIGAAHRVRCALRVPAKRPFEPEQHEWTRAVHPFSVVGTTMTLEVSGGV